MDNISQAKIVYSFNYDFAKPRPRHNAHMGFFQIIDKELVYLQSSFSDEFHKNRTKEMIFDINPHGNHIARFYFVYNFPNCFLTRYIEQFRKIDFPLIPFPIKKFIGI